MEKIQHIYYASLSPQYFYLFLSSEQCQKLCLQNPLKGSILNEERHQQHQHQHQYQKHPMLRWLLPMAARTLNMFQNHLTVKGCQQFLVLKFKGSFEWLTCLERKSLVLLIFVSPFCYVALSLFLCFFFFSCVGSMVWFIVVKFSFFWNWCIVWRSSAGVLFFFLFIFWRV